MIGQMLSHGSLAASGECRRPHRVLYIRLAGEDPGCLFHQGHVCRGIHLAAGRRPGHVPPAVLRPLPHARGYGYGIKRNNKGTRAVGLGQVLGGDSDQDVLSILRVNMIIS